MSNQTARTFLAATCALMVGVVLGQTGKSDRQADAQVASARAASGRTASAGTPFPMQMRVGGNLYLQTSAEYQAACLQVYRCAEYRLRELAESDSFREQRPAVVMDLDETVFDNSSFQTYLYRTGQEYTDELWANYERNFARDVTLIPGAKRFIEEATALGVSIVFLSNRTEDSRTATLSALERLDVAGSNVGDRLILKAGGASSDKSSRRDRVAAQYNVVLLVGDNLRDFAEVFVAPKIPDRPTPQDVLAAITARKAEVERAAVHWGTNWFILPNPVYGEWDKLIKVDPVALMHPTSMPVRPNR